MTEDHEISDPQLLQRATGGCAESFAELFRRYYERVRSFSYRIVLEYQTADDIAQETFIRAARKISTLRTDQAFGAWIFRIASNVAKDHLRAQTSRDKKHREMIVNQQIPDPEDAQNSEERAARVHRAMQALTPQQREAVTLVWFENCTHAEAAARISCPVATVSWRMALAKRILRKLLSP